MKDGISSIYVRVCLFRGSDEFHGMAYILDSSISKYLRRRGVHKRSIQTDPPSRKEISDLQRSPTNVVLNRDMGMQAMQKYLSLIYGRGLKNAQFDYE